MKQFFDIDDNLLELSEVLIALSICSVTNPIIENALEQLNKLKTCDIYITYIIPDSELKTLKNLGINVISEPTFYSENSFIY